MNLLITGTGRCGTGFMSRVLTEAGYPCSHEGVYTPHGPTPFNPPAESSWMAAPYLHAAHVPIVLIFRNPADVVRSMLGIKFFETPGPYRDFALYYEPSLSRLSPVDACWAWWTVWNERIVEHATAFFHVDAPRWNIIGSLVGMEADPLRESARKIGSTYNTRPKAPASDICAGRRRLRARALNLQDQLRSQS